MERTRGEKSSPLCKKKVHYHMPEGLHDFTFIVYRKAASLLTGFMDQEQGRKKCTPTQFSHQILLRFHCKDVTAHTQHNHPCWPSYSNLLENTAPSNLTRFWKLNLAGKRFA